VSLKAQKGKISFLREYWNPAEIQKAFNSAPGVEVKVDTDLSKATKAEKVYLITGASRGLGLEMVRQLALNDKNFIFATARDPAKSPDLKTIVDKSDGRIVVIPMDVVDEKSIAKAAEIVKTKTNRIDILINNAGVGMYNTPGKVVGDDLAPTVDHTNLSYMFQTNVVGTHWVTQAFLPLLEAAKSKDGKLDLKSTNIPKIVCMSTTKASLALTDGTLTSYVVSKAALHMLARCYSKACAGMCVFPIDGGWSDTAMGKSKDIPALRHQDAVTGILSVIANATLEQNGQYLQYTGQLQLW